MLHRHEWTGNVRELENLVRRLAILYSDDVITAEMVLQEFSKDISAMSHEKEGDTLSTMLEEACKRLLNEPLNEDGDVTPYQRAMAWIEKPLIIETLRQTGGNRAKAADILGIHRNTLRTRLKSLDIS